MKRKTIKMLLHEAEGQGIKEVIARHALGVTKLTIIGRVGDHIEVVCQSTGNSIMVNPAREVEVAQ